MAMAEGHEGLPGAMQVEHTSQGGGLQPESFVQDEKSQVSEVENKVKQTKETCGDDAQRNGKGCEITLPLGCKNHPKSEHDIVAYTNAIMEFLKSMNMPLIREYSSFQQQHQVYQNVSVNDLKEILENTCTLLREGHQNSPELFALTYTLDMCCTTSAAVKRVLSVPGIVPLLKGFIDTYFVAFIGTPFLNADQLCYLAMSITSTLRIAGKFMLFPKLCHSDDLFTWWKNIDELYRERTGVVTFNVPPHMAINGTYNCLEVLTGVVMKVSKSAKLMQANDLPKPCEVMSGLNCTNYYAVFCSSLQCPVFAEEDGVLLHCARCKLAAYCSRKCQRQHWKQGHKEKCWKMTWDFNFGLKIIESCCIWGMCTWSLVLF